MTWNEFYQGSLLESSKEKKQDVRKWFDNADQDVSGTLSCPEFNAMMHWEDEEKDKDPAKLY